MDKVSTNIDVRQAIYRQDIILIPDSYIYESDIFYEDHTLDRARKGSINIGKYWVYHNLNLERGTIQKKGVDYLENKHYVAAIMNLPTECDWKSPRELKEKQMYKNFQKFLQGKGPLPKLKEIYKKNRVIGDEDRFDLQENIENSITLHWVYIHKERLGEFIREYV